MRKRYCSKCGLTMVPLPVKGNPIGVDFLGDYQWSFEKFDQNTGKPLRLYSCPQWGTIAVGWPFKRKEENGHDRYLERAVGKD